MKKIIISGSSKLVDKVKCWVSFFENKGYEILDYPKYVGEADEAANYDEALTKVYNEYYRSLEKTDIFFLMNEQKMELMGTLVLLQYPN